MEKWGEVGGCGKEGMRADWWKGRQIRWKVSGDDQSDFQMLGEGAA